MKIAAIIVRALMGLLFLFASITFLFNLMPPPELTGRVKVFMDGMNATGYMMTLVKGTELICGLAFVTGFYVPLAAVILSPIIINIFLFHAFVEPSGLIMASLLVLGNAFLGYVHWDKYRPMMSK